VDFNEDAKKEDGVHYAGRWSGSVFDMLFCDPTREQVYHRGTRYDLKSGRRVGSFTFPSDMA